MEVKRRRFLIILSSALFILLGVTGLFIYEYFRIKPNDVHFTNVTSSSVTVSWNTEKAIAGTVKVKESGSFLPFALFNRGNRFFDTRDVKNAEVLGVEATAENVSEGDDFVVSSSDFVTDVKVTDMGDYYTHHVTVTGLDSETEYSFMVGDTLLFRDVKDYEGNESITTLEVPESVKSPYPAYGSVKDAGNDDIPIDQLSVVDDGVVYVNYLDKNTNIRSDVFSSPLNSEGNWYVDMSEAKDSEGNYFLETYATPDENVLIEVTVDAGELGLWQSRQFSYLMSPVPPIILNMPSSVQDLDIEGSVVPIDVEDVKGEETVVMARLDNSIREAECINSHGFWDESTSTCECFGGMILDGDRCTCPEGYEFNDDDNTCNLITNNPTRTCPDCEVKCPTEYPLENPPSSGNYEEKEFYCYRNWSDGSGECGIREAKICYKDTTPVSTDPGTCVFDDYCGPCRLQYKDGSYGEAKSCECQDIVDSDGTAVLTKRMCVGTTEARTYAENNLKCGDGTAVSENTVVYYSGSCRKCELAEQSNYYIARWNDVSDQYEYDSGSNSCVKISDTVLEEIDCQKNGGTWDDIEGCVYPKNPPITDPITKVPAQECGRCSSMYKYAYANWEVPENYTIVDKSKSACEDIVSNNFNQANVKYSCNKNCCIDTFFDKDGNEVPCKANWEGYTSCDVSIQLPQANGPCENKNSGDSCIPQKNGEITGNNLVCSSRAAWDPLDNEPFRCVPLGYDCTDIVIDNKDNFRYEIGSSGECLKTTRCRGGYKLADTTPPVCELSEINFKCSFETVGEICPGTFGKEICTQNGNAGGMGVPPNFTYTCEPISSDFDCNEDTVGDECPNQNGAICTKVITGGMSPIITYSCKDIFVCNYQTEGQICPSGSGQVCTRVSNAMGTETIMYSCLAPLDNTRSNWGTQYPELANFVKESFEVEAIRSERSISMQREFIFPIINKFTNSLVVNNQVLAASTDNQNTDQYIIDPQTGMFIYIPTGVYSFEYEGETYLFLITEENYDQESNGVLVYIDENGNGGYDEGTDLKVTDIASMIKIVSIEKTYSYSLTQGLNFISLPFLVSSQDHRTAASLLAKLNEVYNDSIYSISRFDGGQWKMVGQNSQLYDNNDFQLLPGVGYVIKAKRDVNISIVGQPVQLETTEDSSPIYFNTGWNLIGLYGTNIKSYTAKTLLEDINTGEMTAINVTDWVENRQMYEGFQVVDGEEYGFDYPLNTLESYFVRIKEGSGNWQPSISGNN